MTSAVIGLAPLLILDRRPAPKNLRLQTFRRFSFALVMLNACLLWFSLKEIGWFGETATFLWHLLHPLTSAIGVQPFEAMDRNLRFILQTVTQALTICTETLLIAWISAWSLHRVRPHRSVGTDAANRGKERQQ
jgi:hypothetical protein